MANPFASIDTPFPDELFLRSMVARERLGRPFVIELQLYGTRGDITFADAIGQRMTVHLEQKDGVRDWNGVVTDFALQGVEGKGQYIYRATLRPWLWLLGYRANCRIFQEKAVPDIVSDLCREHGSSELRSSLSETYSPREYCVQYRESDFAFISRLLEQCGIYYFFEHEGQEHTLVLADSSSAHTEAAGYEEIPYRPQDSGSIALEIIDSWSITERLEPGAVALDDFDFTTPRGELLVKRISSHPLAQSDKEIYDYPGAYNDEALGGLYAKVGLEAMYARQAMARGTTTARGLRVGSAFTLVDHPRADQNKKHLIVETTHEISGLVLQSGGGSSGGQFSCHFEAIDFQRPFRTDRTTPKPIVHGPQTALVVGKSGEEIWTDEHGRVKLKFHWDRAPEQDETVSCWVRVAQMWAGGGWGALHVPRIGQEVVVEFLEGDPDRPLVTGRLYNGEQKSPYELPAHADHSGVKSRSTKNGGADNANELRFEDTKDSERILLHAEKDLVTEVENDETRTVDHDRTTTIKNDEKVTVEGNRTEEVKKDETITIRGLRTETVEKDETITVKGTRTETVEGDETVTVKGSRSHTVETDETVSITGNRTESVDGDETITIGGNRAEEVGGDESVTISGGYTGSVGAAWALTISSDGTLEIQGKRETTVSGEDKLTVQKLVVEADQEITFKTGQASVTLKSSGEITIKGGNIKVEGQSGLTLSSQGSAKLEGSTLDVKAQSALSLAGSIIKGG